ncbi:MAG: hypothetical protein F6K17_24305 [Okeania sp. SIO3C4]|nr:hypothetical protein [Okeania sp. SIO3B3]NER05487.1 hypothetical protein [Okeania sp. SIO3C4]
MIFCQGSEYFQKLVAYDHRSDRSDLNPYNAAINILEVVQPKTKVETAKTRVAKKPIQLSLFNEVADGQWSII